MAEQDFLDAWPRLEPSGNDRRQSDGDMAADRTMPAAMTSEGVVAGRHREATQIVDRSRQCPWAKERTGDGETKLAANRTVVFSGGALELGRRFLPILPCAGLERSRSSVREPCRAMQGPKSYC
jgi:hypothetical protein